MSNSTSLRITLMALTSALIVSSCSGSDAPESSAPQEPSTAAEQTSPAPDETTVEDTTAETAEAVTETVTQDLVEVAQDHQAVANAMEFTWENTAPERRVVVCEDVATMSDQEVVDMTGSAIDLEVGDLSEFEDIVLGFWDDKCDEVAQSQEIPNYQVGDLIEGPSADIIVNVLEERDSIHAPSYDSGVITPGAGERLWYVDITWTNNSTQAVGKECHGPYSMDLSAYDLQGREMLMVDQPGYIEGQECSTGLMQGQTGTWLSAFHGLDEDFGWLVFNDYEGGEHVVVMDPSVTVSRAN